MTDQTDRIKQMAQEAGFSVGSWPGRGEVITADHSIDVTEWLTKFAALVAEDCADCANERLTSGRSPMGKVAAEAIRARYAIAKPPDAG